MSAARVLLLGLLALVLARPALRAQEPEALLELDLRVLRVLESGSVLVDRGERDAVAVGDLVWLYPREDGSLQGSVRAVEPRVARVELLERGARPPAGTRGVVLVPAARLEVPERAPSLQLPDHPPWANSDGEWTPDQPLLAEVEVLSPEQRPMRWGGRWYLSTDHVFYDDDADLGDRSDQFTRTGFDLFYENPFGRGGLFEVDAEVNQRETELSDLDGEDRRKGRLDRLSYSWGGTRFAPTGHQLGRFLQRGTPEFGVLDGYELSHRLQDGDELSASVGWLPEPDRDQASFDDFQVAATYRWVADENERVSVATGVQKTWHDGEADRDLLVANLRVLRDEGWTWHATAWVDAYRGDDDPKDEGFELTRVRASASRRAADGGLERWSYLHAKIPFTQREAFSAPVATALDDSRTDRVAYSRTLPWTTRTEIFLETGVWVDDEENGGDAELGVAVDDIGDHQGEVRVSGFVTRGEFSEELGGRLAYALAGPTGRWDLGYELSRERSLGFTAGFASQVQHSLRLSHDVLLDDPWDLRLTADLRRLEEQSSYAVGVHLQRRF